MEYHLLTEILDSVRNVRIAVSGDFCLDAYWFINDSKSEISVETGLPTRPVQSQKYLPGGAGNVANNLAAMQVKEVFAFGVAGDDPFGYEMRRILNSLNINTENLLVQNKNWATHVYTKPYSREKELNRIDFGNFNILSRKTADLLIKRLAENINNFDIIILNQQVISGINTPYFREKITEVIKKSPGKIFIVDSRNYSGEYHGAYRKMNQTEALRLSGRKADPDDPFLISEIREVAAKLCRKFGKPVFITCGSKGSVVADKSGVFEIPALMILSKTDPVGAGDSYLAGVAAALAAGYPVNLAAGLGTLVAAVTVRKLFQTGTANPEEILQTGRDPDLIYNPDLAENTRLAKYQPNTEIEIINIPAVKRRISNVIFDNDGTVSTLREGWENIMAPVMEKAILGDHYNTAEESVYLRVKNRVREFISQTTGIQTLIQMKMLPSIIREFGLVPEKKILNEYEYKKIYNDELMKLVKKREEKLRCGELSVQDLTIKNSIETIKILYERGLKLYLASGTDMEDVIHEAEILGYAHFFEGRIFGAVGDVTREAKKEVLDKILDTIGPSEADCIVTFGDGPVEIRETRKRGGIAVGVASNELRRFGLNEMKRTRLIKAGADFIIPDFSQSLQLLSLLKII